MNFNQAVHIIFQREGYLSDDPRDRGGMTKYGISKRAYPHLCIKSITREEAKEIYRVDYWNRAKCESMPKGLRLAVFDSAVNQGVKTAIILVQRTVKVKEDGIFGPNTQQRTAQLYAHNRKELLLDFLSWRIKHYASLRDFDIYGRGWVKRIFHILNESRSVLSTP